MGLAAHRADVDPEANRRRRLVDGVLGCAVGGGADRRVSAVVEYYGGWPAWEELNPARLPPVLILHGDLDRNVPVEEAHKLEQLLQAAGVSYEMQIYPAPGMVSVTPITTTPSSVPSRSSISMSNVLNAEMRQLPGRGDEKPRRSPCG